MLSGCVLLCAKVLGYASCGDGGWVLVGCGGDTRLAATFTDASFGECGVYAHVYASHTSAVFYMLHECCQLPQGDLL